MRGNDLVSVIIIFLNAERFLEEAIESVFAQTYGAWELLLVDDGSTDRSTAIARRYAEQYPDQVRYLEHECHRNRGKSASRNLGIRCAAGEFIAFLDADDVWLPQKLEQQVALLRAHPEAGMVYGPTLWWYSWTGKPEDSGRDYMYDLGVPPNSLFQPPDLFAPFFLQQKAAVPCPCSILVRREVAEHAGGFEESFTGSYDVYEDQTFYAKVLLQAPVFVTDACLDRYRQHPDSSCAVVEKNGQEMATRRFFLDWLARYVSKQGVKDAAIRRRLQFTRLEYRYPLLHSLTQQRQRFMSAMQSFLLGAARRIVPLPVRGWLWAKLNRSEYLPPVGWVRFGNLRRVTPVSREFGYDRGQPIDRYYIERFLVANASDIQGRVLEIADNSYTLQFGGDRVTTSDVLHAVAGNPQATIIGDLTCADHIPACAFDCVIVTQTLQVIYDVPAAIRTLYRILKPGGVLLVTVPGISQISLYDKERWGYFWSFTTLSARRLFEECFSPSNLTVEGHGNVLSAVSMLQGLAVQELTPREMDHVDPAYEVIITVRAVKAKSVLQDSQAKAREAHSGSSLKANPGA